MEWAELLCSERVNTYNKSSNNKSKDYRSEFEKDYNRIVISSSFRRLQDKTQVFPLDKSDFIRTRLTHSLEVSSTAKSLGQAIARQLISNNENLPENFEADITSILSCAGLLHDIGNPPFGHFCEYSIREFFKKNLNKIEYKVDENTTKKISDILTEQMLNDLYNFEGNAQALRLVSKLHFLVNFNGMNLTKALLSTLIKYPCNSLQLNKNKVITKKVGYFLSEKELFSSITEGTKTKNTRHPLTYILEAADDISYCTADIEDGFKKCFFTYHDFLEEFSYTDENDSDKEYKDHFKTKLEEKFQKSNKTESENNELYAIQNFLIYVQGILIKNASDTFLNKYNEIMNGTFDGDLFENEYSNFISKKLKDIAKKYIFSSNAIMELEISSHKIINYFLENMVNAVLYYDPYKDGRIFGSTSNLDTRFISIMSENYKECYKHYGKKQDDTRRLYLRLLLATDCICGMTDSYSKNLYQKLNGII